MHITIIGAGYVGLVTGACLAELGHRVTCIDKDTQKINGLRQGKMPIYEPGLAELVAKNVTAGRLAFTEQNTYQAEIVMLAVGTPSEGKDGRADMRYVYAAAKEIAASGFSGLVVTKSTVPVGTGRELENIFAGKKIQVVSNPEFLREGSAIKDFMEADRIVIGTTSEPAKKLLEELYKPLTDKGVPLVATDLETSELIKYASNAFLACKVGFINEIADLCEQVGANVEEVSRGMGYDKRIGSQFLRPGPGYGGSCFPKDTLALLHSAGQSGAPLSILHAVVTSNQQRRDRMAEKIIAAFGGKVKGKTLAVLGLTFKPNTDDIRESPALAIIPHLIKAGATIHAYDPQGMAHAKTQLPAAVTYVSDAYAAMQGADGVVILTEWEEFKTLDLAKTKPLLKTPLMVDLRNLFDPAAMKKAGFTHVSVGRGTD